MTEENLKEVIGALAELIEDSTVPRNIKNKIGIIINTLKEKTDLSIRVNKALHSLDEIADDTNLQSYTRTQLWNVVSLLEKV